MNRRGRESFSAGSRLVYVFGSGCKCVDWQKMTPDPVPPLSGLTPSAGRIVDFGRIGAAATLVPDSPRSSANSALRSCDSWNAGDANLEASALRMIAVERLGGLTPCRSPGDFGSAYLRIAAARAGRLRAGKQSASSSRRVVSTSSRSRRILRGRVSRSSRRAFAG